MTEEKPVVEQNNMDEQQPEENYMTYIFTAVKLLVMVFLTGAVVTSAFIAGVVFQNGRVATAQVPQVMSSDEAAPGFGIFWEAWQIINNEFYGDIPSEQERVYGAVRGMVNTFGDANTAFIDPVNADIFRENSSGSYAGIGAAVNLDELGRLIIVEPFLGRPAAEAGLQRNDVVLEVDGQPLRGLSLTEGVALIRGPVGSTVVLTILRDGEEEPFEVSIERANIEIEVVEAELLESNIAHVTLSDFSSGAAEKLYQAIREMENQGAEGLILDLRANPGGFLQESVAVTSLFIQDEVVLRERGRDIEGEEIFETMDLPSFETIPMVVLIDRGSASASEIVAGALKDHGRAAIIGEQSFGKGTVQISRNLSDGSEIRVTIAEWLTPDGHFIHENGIVPDVVVERTQEDFFDGLDPQLDRAIEYLQSN